MRTEKKCSTENKKKLPQPQVSVATDKRDHCGVGPLGTRHHLDYSC